MIFVFTLAFCHGHKAAQVCAKHNLTVNINRIFNRTESNYTEAELDHNDQWDKWGHHKDTSNKDLTTCFDCNECISSTGMTSSVCSGEQITRQFLPATALHLLSTALTPVSNVAPQQSYSYTHWIWPDKGVLLPFHNWKRLARRGRNIMIPFTIFTTQ